MANSARDFDSSNLSSAALISSSGILAPEHDQSMLVFMRNKNPPHLCPVSFSYNQNLSDDLPISFCDAGMKFILSYFESLTNLFWET